MTLLPVSIAHCCQRISLASLILLIATSVSEAKKKPKETPKEPAPTIEMWYQPLQENGAEIYAAWSEWSETVGASSPTEDEVDAATYEPSLPLKEPWEIWLGGGLGAFVGGMILLIKHRGEEL